MTSIQQENRQRIEAGEFPRMQSKAGWRSVFRAADEFWSTRHKIERWDALLTVLVQQVADAIEDDSQPNRRRLWEVQMATASLYQQYPEFLSQPKEDA